MYKLVILALLAFSLNANELTLKEGKINAHTEVFGDSKIDPYVEKIDINLSYQDSIESIRGLISINSYDLVSDNKSRDESMYDTINAKLYPKIKFSIIDIKKIDKESNNYMIKGFLTLNNISKKVESICEINFNDTLYFNGFFEIYLTDFNIKPPSLLFLNVRNRVDIDYNLILIGSKKNEEN